MSAKVPKADIKARGELDGRAHTCRPGRGEPFLSEFISFHRVPPGRGMMYRGQTVGHGVRLWTVNVCDNER